MTTRAESLLPLRFQVPWPPSANNLYPTSRSGHRFPSKRLKEYHAAVMAELVRLRVPRERITERIALTLLLQPPDLRRRDISNTVKAIEDALTQSGVWADDCQVDELHVHRCMKYPGGIVTVEIKPVEE
jgi:crossover junction endodeoxyribonuclease RusA